MKISGQRGQPVCTGPVVTIAWHVERTTVGRVTGIMGKGRRVDGKGDLISATYTMWFSLISNINLAGVQIILCI